MRALTKSGCRDGSLLADYTDRMGEALARRQADVAIRAARIEADLSIKARSEFLANMNHELRTPLNAIIGFGTMLRDGDEYSLAEDQRKSYTEYILQSADLLLGHINTLLEVAALESGSIEIRSGEVDLGKLLDDALERIAIRAGAAKIRVERKDDGAPVIGWGDAERLGQAMDHVLQAAVKFCEEGGRVMVRATIDERGWPEIAVRDDGAGLDRDELAEALDVFDQPQRGLDRSFSGPGVGYAVAKTFVEMQGGRFIIKSRKGQGTLARISLPPAAAKSQPDQTPDEEHDPAIVERTHDAA